MNKEWSESNHLMQILLKKKETYQDGITALFQLRAQLMQTLLSFRAEFTREEFSAIPFIHADGLHNATIAYSLWHIFRIEDIVAHTIIQEDEQVFFSGNYQVRMHAPIVTTGNELVKQQIADFSEKLELNALYSYMSEVKESTEMIISKLPYEAMKRKVPPECTEKLRSLGVVSKDASACWLIDYWCGKDIRGLIQMPFSRHWIMHTEACLRIAGKLNQQKKA